MKKHRKKIEKKAEKKQEEIIEIATKEKLMMKKYTEKSSVNGQVY